MLLKTLKKQDFTLFYFDRHGSYSELLDSIQQYIDAGTTHRELFFFDTDAQFITPEQVRKIVPVASRAADVRKPGGKTALLYGRVSLYGLGRVYKVLEEKIVRKTWSTEVFKDLEKACSWLDISADLIRSMITQNNMTSEQKPFSYLIE